MANYSNARHQRHRSFFFEHQFTKNGTFGQQQNKFNPTNPNFEAVRLFTQFNLPFYCVKIYSSERYLNLILKKKEIRYILNI